MSERYALCQVIVMVTAPCAGDCLYHFFYLFGETKREMMLVNMFSPTFVPDLMTLTCKISPGMPTPASSLMPRSHIMLSPYGSAVCGL